MKKRTLASVLAVGMAVAMLTGCQSKQEPKPADTSTPTETTSTEKPAEEAGDKTAVDFPGSKTITMIVPWAAGGGSDLGARIAQPYLEEAIGTKINIVNKPGASGWVGWEELLAANADGYTIAMINTPPLFSGYLDPANERTATIDDFTGLARHVTDYCVMAVRKDDDRFQTMEDLINFAKDNELTCGTTGIGSDDHFLLAALNKINSIDMTPVPSGGWKDNYAALLGGHIDISAANVGEVATLEDVRTLCVFAEERSEFLPDVPTWNELKLGDELTLYSGRGFAMKAGAPQEAVDVLVNGFEKALTNEDQIAKMAELGLQCNFIGGAEYDANLREEEEFAKSYADIMGWE